MRVAIATESFLPSLNGVTTSVCRVTEELGEQGHEAMIIAPGPAPASYVGHPVRSLPGVTVRGFRAGLPTRELSRALHDFRPDVVHLASPFLVGACGVREALSRDVPTVAIYQTDMPSYVQQHGPGAVGRGAGALTWRWIRRLHERADLTLAPSQPTLEELRRHGVPRTGLWGRGVDTRLFSPSWREEEGTLALREALAPRGEVILGYVGRLAPEKELHRLVELASLPGTRLVLVGEGPSRNELGALLTEAVATSGRRPNLPPAFLGSRTGHALARAYAAFDVFVHTGTKETFGQTLQEAAATGMPVVAPCAGGPLDLVDHGVTGLHYDPARPGALRAAVAQLAESPALRERMARAGAERVAGRSWAALTAQLVTHYEGVIAGRVA
ncbi:glycosyltransferase family 4 protein [Marihabitans asiaticum]|uniref:D-inositol 3-phosphate glycosyltransferase n=1 Tax=Marihabitans asiaticum TaxID=415218 RepID=A0A560WCS8_9MICO|nr:glycosyltransferase family 1 protein [Marihabitans asiaticum]TWD15489.1 phosphatidylinositol alpha 1,6-mannosyltransferase [Marihabitans asiaticum]